jgi:hypothetical protein
MADNLHIAGLRTGGVSKTFGSSAASMKPTDSGAYEVTDYRKEVEGRQTERDRSRGIVKDENGGKVIKSEAQADLDYQRKRALHKFLFFSVFFLLSCWAIRDCYNYLFNRPVAVQQMPKQTGPQKVVPIWYN